MEKQFWTENGKKGDKMEILKVTEHEDDSATIEYVLTALERKTIKRVLEVKKLTKKRINDFIRRTIIAGANRDAKKLIKGVK